MAYNKEELLNLPVDEKLELVEALWDRIDDDLLGKELSRDEIEKELNRRISNIIKNPQALVSWEDVKNKMSA